MTILIVGDTVEVKQAHSAMSSPRILRTCFYIRNFKNETSEEIVSHEDVPETCRGVIFKVSKVIKLNPKDGEVMDANIPDGAIIRTHPYFVMTSDNEITFMTEESKRVFLEV